MADLSVPQNLGGQYGAIHTGGNVETAINTTAAGRLCRVTIITAGTAANSIYDGTNSTAGTLIWTDITNRTVGQQVDLQIPIATGIVVKGTTGAAGLYVSYNKTGALGN